MSRWTIGLICPGRWPGPASLAPGQVAPGRLPVRRNRRSARRTGGSGSRRAAPAAVRYAHRIAAGCARLREMRRCISGRWSAACRSSGRGSDGSVRATPGRLLRGGRSLVRTGGRVSGLPKVASMNCPGFRLTGQFVQPRLQGRHAGVLGIRQASRAVSAAIRASFSAWLSCAGAGSRGTRCLKSTRPSPRQEVSGACCQATGLGQVARPAAIPRPLPAVLTTSEDQRGAWPVIPTQQNTPAHPHRMRDQLWFRRQYAA